MRFLIIISIFFTWQVEAKDYLEMSKRLAKLRADVERINKDIQAVRLKNSTEINSLSLQQAEIDSMVRKEEVVYKQLEQKIGHLKKRIQKDSGESSVQIPVILSATQMLKDYVETSVPYKKQERLNSITKLEGMLEKEELSAQRAALKLWGLYDDEMRLTEEIMLGKQEISLSGQDYLVDVIKVGAFGMYFKSADLLFGKVTKQDQKWVATKIENQDQVDAITALFDGYKKQIKTANYLLPNIFFTQEQQ